MGTIAQSESCTIHKIPCESPWTSPVASVATIKDCPTSAAKDLSQTSTQDIHILSLRIVVACACWLFEFRLMPIGHQRSFSKWIPPLSSLASASTSSHIHQSYHQLSSTIINCHQLSSTIINYHQLSSTIINYHQLSSTIINYHISHVNKLIAPQPNETRKRRSWGLDPYQPGHCSWNPGGPPWQTPQLVVTSIVIHHDKS